VTATVIDIRSRRSTPLTHAEPIEGRTVDHGGLTVTHLGFDSDLGWHIELARPDQLTDGKPAPSTADLPVDVRAALLQFMGITAIGII
jgi:hypothetical protein